MTLDDVDWSAWQPRDRATLLFVIDGERTLLIRKKRGLGAGKINAPGGRIEPGELPIEAAVREVVEETGVTPSNVHERGVLRFQFVDGYSLHCHVFWAFAWDGEPHETPEAAPRWVDLDALPYAEMWADDALWLPIMLAGDAFDGWFIFDGDDMLDHRLERRAGDPNQR